MGKTSHSVVDERPVPVPADIAAAIHERNAVLVAGAGMSMEAGLPGASIYSDIMHQHNLAVDEHYWRGAASSLESIAEDYELVTKSRAALIERIKSSNAISIRPAPARQCAGVPRTRRTLFSRAFWKRGHHLP